MAVERPPLQPKKINKYLQGQNNSWRNQPPEAPSEDIKDIPITCNEDTVQSFKVPEMHHAEVVNVRQDETSSSSSSEHEHLEESARNVQGVEEEVDGQKSPAKARIGSDSSWENNRNSFNPYIPDEHGVESDGSDQFPVPERGQKVPKKKGGNFFSSLFKNKGTKGRSGAKGKRQRPKSEYYDDRDNHNESYEDHGVYHASEEAANREMERSKSSYEVRQDSSALYQNFPAPPTAEEYGIDNNDGTEPRLQRKLSMSKPTNLDDILRQQEEEDREKAKVEDKEDVFKNDPWFQSRGEQMAAAPELPKKGVPTAEDSKKKYENPIYANLPSITQIPVFLDTHETTQEIDVDAALGYCDDSNLDGQPAIEEHEKAASEIDQIVWPKGSREELKDSQRGFEIDQIVWPKGSREELQDQRRIEIEYDYSPKGRQKKKTNFFNFGKKKSKTPPRDSNHFYHPEPGPIRTTAENYLANKQQPEVIHVPIKIEVAGEASGSNNDDHARYNNSSNPASSRDSSPENLQPKQTTKRKGLGGFFNSKKELHPGEDNNTSEMEPSELVQEKPVKPAKPGFFKTRSKNDRRDVKHEEHSETLENTIEYTIEDTVKDPVEDTTTVQEEIEDDHNATVRSANLNTSFGSNSSGRRQKPKGGLKGFFRKPGLRPKSPGDRLGNVEPVDVAHLVDDEDYNRMMESDPPLETSPPKENFHHSYHDLEPSFNDTQDKEAPKKASTSSSSDDGKEEPKVQRQPLSIAPEDEISAVEVFEPNLEPMRDRIPLPEPVEMSPPVATSQRGRSRRKSGGKGLGSLFGKPPSRPQSRSRNHEDQGSAPRAPRSKSLPRKQSGGGGLGSLFGPQRPRPRQRSMERTANNEISDDQNSQQSTGSRPPPRKSEGFGSLFSMAPRHTRPTKGKPTPRREIADDTKNIQKQDYDEEPPPNIRERRSSNKGLSGLFNSTRRVKNMKKSTSTPNTLQRSRQKPEEEQQGQTSMMDSLYRDQPAQQYQKDQEPELSKSKVPTRTAEGPRVPQPGTEKPPQPGTEKLPQPSSQTMQEFTKPEEPLRPSSRAPQSGREEISRPSPQRELSMPDSSQHQPSSEQQVSSGLLGRQTGRRTGRFSRKSGDHPTPSYGINPPPGIDSTAISHSRPVTEQNIMQDIFIQQASRPSSRPASRLGSRRNSNTSINSAENLADLAYQEPMKANKQLKKSSSSLGRTESYKQARGGGAFEHVDAEEDPNLSRVGKGRQKRYNSMPRLSSKTRQQQQQQFQQGILPRPHSRGGNRPQQEDNCKVM